MLGIIIFFIGLLFNDIIREVHDNGDILALQRCNSSIEYSIHGLWKKETQFCKNDSFELDTISSLIPTLNVVWYSCYDNIQDRYYYSNVDFWKHEYNKHGSCFNISEFDYFNNTIDLYYKYKNDCDPNKYECLINTHNLF